jgi:hypothetical protein
MARLTSRVLDYSSAVGIYSESLKQPALEGGRARGRTDAFSQKRQFSPEHFVTAAHSKTLHIDSDCVLPSFEMGLTFVLRDRAKV